MLHKTWIDVACFRWSELGRGIFTSMVASNGSSGAKTVFWCRKMGQCLGSQSIQVFQFQHVLQLVPVVTAWYDKLLLNCLENAKLHIQNRQRHNLLLAYPRKVLPFWETPNPRFPESPQSWYTKPGKNVGNNPHQAPPHPRCAQNIPGHHWQQRSAHQEGAFSRTSHGLVHALFWKMTIYLKSHPCSFS